MNPMPPDLFLYFFHLENEQRVRAAERRRLAASIPRWSPARRLAGRTLVRLGVLVGGRALRSSTDLVPAHRGGSAR